MAGTVVSSTRHRKGLGIVRIDVDLTCVSGAVSRQRFGTAYGRIVALEFDPTAGAGATMTSTADVLITDENGAAILTDLTFGSGERYRPTAVVTDNAGAAISASTSANGVNRDIFVAGGLYVSIANATTTDTGRFSVIVQEG